MLKVEVLRNTKILDIQRDTERSLKTAHNLSLYLAEQTVKMNENTSRQGDREFATEARSDLSPHGPVWMPHSEAWELLRIR